MMRFFDSVASEIIMRLFVWSDSKLFGTMVIYCPKPGEDIRAVHFAEDKEVLKVSCREIEAEQG